MTDRNSGKSVAIIGAGAMGCFFAARLASSGAEVTLVDVDAARLAMLEESEIVLETDGCVVTAKVFARLAADLEGPFSLVVVFTKGMHTAAAVASVGHVAGGGTPVLTLQNGIGNAEVIAAHFPCENVLMGVTDYPADLKNARTVASHGKGQIRLGGFCREAMAHVPSIADMLNVAGLDTIVDDHVEVAIWEKLAFNAALNSIATVTGLPNGGFDVAAGHRIIEQVVAETVAVAGAKGIALDSQRIHVKIASALKHHRAHQPSMLQDRLAGRPTEIDQINGAIEREAAALGLRVPVTSTLADLVRLVS